MAVDFFQARAGVDRATEVEIDAAGPVDLKNGLWASAGDRNARSSVGKIWRPRLMAVTPTTGWSSS